MALEKAGLLVPVVVADIAGDVVDDSGTERDFQPLNGLQAEQTQLLVKLVAVQDVIQRNVGLKIGRAGLEEAAPVAAKPVIGVSLD